MKRDKLKKFFLFFILILFNLIPQTGKSQSVENALKLYQDGNLGQSLISFKNCLSSGNNNQSQLKIIWVHLGVLEAGLGETDNAIESFKKLFSIDFNVEPPPEASPDIIELMNKAKKFLDGKGLSISIDNQLDNNNKSINVKILHDSAKLTSKVTLLINGMNILSRSSDKSVELPIPESYLEKVQQNEKMMYSVNVTDEFGNIIWASTEEELEINNTSIQKTVLTIEHEGDNKVIENEPVYKKWWFWTLIGVVVVGGGVTAGVLLSEPQIEYEIGGVKNEY